MPLYPLIQYQQKTDPLQPLVNSVESAWHYGWSEPVRVKPGQHPSRQSFYVSGTILPPPVFLGWMVPLAEPVRIRPGLLTASQQAWFFGIPGLSIGWLKPLSEPVRFRPILFAGTQPHNVWNTITPPPTITHTASMSATEQGDLDIFSARSYNFVRRAFVSIIKK